MQAIINIKDEYANIMESFWYGDERPKIYFVKNLTAKISIINNKVEEADILAFYNNSQNIKFTIRTNDQGEKITTLFSSKAKPLVDRYKFISKSVNLIPSPVSKSAIPWRDARANNLASAGISLTLKLSITNLEVDTPSFFKE